MNNKQMNDFEKLYRQNRLLDIALEHCFNVALSDFEQIKKMFGTIGSWMIEWH